MKKKCVAIAAAVSLAGGVPLACSGEAVNESGMEYWNGVVEEVHASVRSGAGVEEALRACGRSFANTTEGLEWLKRHSACVSAVSVTAGGLTVRYDAPEGDSGLPAELVVETFGTDASLRLRGRLAGGVQRGLAPGEELALPLDKKTVLDRPGCAYAVFTPVTFKGGGKGFRISAVKDFYLRHSGFEKVTHTLCVALSDTPVEVGEKDIDRDILITAEGSDGVALLRRTGWFDAVGVTSGSLSLGFSPRFANVAVRLGGAERLSAEYIAGNEPLTLLPRQEAAFTEERDYAGSLTLSPVSFKNPHKGLGGAADCEPLEGFKVTLSVGNAPGGDELMTDTRYIVLSDTPMLMGEAELDDAPPTPPNPEKPPKPPPQAEPQPAAAESGQPETQAEARTLWPYALIPPAFLAALYFMWKKRK